MNPAKDAHAETLVQTNEMRSVGALVKMSDVRLQSDRMEKAPKDGSCDFPSVLDGSEALMDLPMVQVGTEMLVRLPDQIPSCFHLERGDLKEGIQ